MISKYFRIENETSIGVMITYFHFDSQPQLGTTLRGCCAEDSSFSSERKDLFSEGALNSFDLPVASIGELVKENGSIGSVVCLKALPKR